jgi:hypothetical protein
VILVRLVRSIAMMAALCLTTGAASGTEQAMIPNRNQKKVSPKTPLAAYQKQVTNVIGNRWYAYTQNKLDLSTCGNLRALMPGFAIRGKVGSLLCIGPFASVRLP